MVFKHVWRHPIGGGLPRHETALASGLCARLVRRKQQLRQRHHQVHLVKELHFTRARRAQVQAEVLLGHEAIVPFASLTPSGLAGVLNTTASAVARFLSHERHRDRSLAP